MFTSAINKQKRNSNSLKTAAVYFGVTIFCIVFDNVYALFGHGVRSDSMSFMYLFALIGGVLPFLFMRFFISEKKEEKTVKHYRLFYNVYNSGIAALIVSAALKGIFEIAGTSSPYLIYFNIAGWAFIVIGFIGYLKNLYL